MSINTLTNAAMARRFDFSPLGTTPKGISGIASAAENMPVPEEVPLSGRASAGINPLATQNANAVNTALHLLFGYIPTEIITVYVAILAAIEQPGGKVGLAKQLLFWSFLAVTPGVVWLVYAAKLKGTDKKIPLLPKTWPAWEMVAGTVAYVAWAIALPSNPFQDAGWYSPAVAGIFVLGASTFLGMLAPFFQSKLGT